MKARVKATGEIVTITGTDGICLTDENGNYHLIRDLEGCEAMPDYWEKLHHQAAIAAMQGILSNTKLMDILGMQKGRELDEMVADLSLKHATTLENKLKEEEKS